MMNTKKQRKLCQPSDVIIPNGVIYPVGGGEGLLVWRELRGQAPAYYCAQINTKDNRVDLFTVAVPYGIEERHNWANTVGVIMCSFQLYYMLFSKDLNPYSSLI
ncbi:hypothetical protein CDAR_50961 [Caerostris darwini]|uniref:Uncharacterized protein n=1 Tax=Caerostris darwini TaxID=1538125 RepID=A0AAV4U611_9ARAC|nr:hypothetical protein CDAR_50961 [Caerostris darwini]